MFIIVFFMSILCEEVVFIIKAFVTDEFMKISYLFMGLGQLMLLILDVITHFVTELLKIITTLL